MKILPLNLFIVSSLKLDVFLMHMKLWDNYGELVLLPLPSYGCRGFLLQWIMTKVEHEPRILVLLYQHKVNLLSLIIKTLQCYIAE